jgi:hypothetical protein
MLPAEKSELWARRIGYGLLLLIALYLLVWLTGFVYRVTRRALEQRQPPPEACLQQTRTG